MPMIPCPVPGGVAPDSPGVLVPAAAGAVLAGYAVAMLVVASRTTIGRDVA